MFVPSTISTLVGVRVTQSLICCRLYHQLFVLEKLTLKNMGQTQVGWLQAGLYFVTAGYLNSKTSVKGGAHMCSEDA